MELEGLGYELRGYSLRRQLACEEFLSFVGYVALWGEENSLGTYRKLSFQLKRLKGARLLWHAVRRH